MATTVSTTPGPATDADIPAYLDALGLPGLADIHVHFMPDAVLRKVWDYFDAAERHYGLSWPIHYRLPEAERIEVLRSFRLAAIPALSYSHKPGMAAWLNEWSGEFARRVPGAVRCATLFPETGVADYVAAAVADRTRLVKVHLQVGGFSPLDPLLDDAWTILEEHGVPVVMHAGSGPIAGEFTGPDLIRELIGRHPRLTLVIAHLGMPEYEEFADLATAYDSVYLDTTMAATDFTEAFAPLPDGFRDRLAALRRKVILGTDFPNIPYPYAHQLAVLTRLGLGDDWMRDVLWRNGKALLGVD
jgi:predicted TIM-barrel fold metal-dependent hydrolase